MKLSLVAFCFMTLTYLFYYCCVTYQNDALLFFIIASLGVIILLSGIILNQWKLICCGIIVAVRIYTAIHYLKTNGTGAQNDIKFQITEINSFSLSALAYGAKFNLLLKLKLNQVLKVNDIIICSGQGKWLSGNFYQFNIVDIKAIKNNTTLLHNILKYLAPAQMQPSQNYCWTFWNHYILPEGNATTQQLPYKIGTVVIWNKILNSQWIQKNVKWSCGLYIIYVLITPFNLTTIFWGCYAIITFLKTNKLKKLISYYYLIIAVSIIDPFFLSLSFWKFILFFKHLTILKDWMNFKTKKRWLNQYYYSTFALPLFWFLTNEINFIHLFFYRYLVQINFFCFLILTFTFGIYKVLDFTIVCANLIKIWIYINHWINLLSFTVKKPPFWMLIMCYLLLIVLWRKRKSIQQLLKYQILGSVVFISVFQSYQFYQPYYEINMLDVGNSMCIVITSPYKKSTIIIDVGTSNNKIRNPQIKTFLKEKSIRKIDALFLTHNDWDHTSNLTYLVNNFQINSIFNNKTYQKSYKVKEFLEIINYNKYYVENSTENNKSLVLLFRFFNYQFLITGDIEAKIESWLQHEPAIRDIDFCQISHHGSKTSSSESFLSHINPKIALISCKNSIKHQLPHPEILARLEKISAKIYSTDKCGTITIRITKNNFKILTHKKEGW